MAVAAGGRPAWARWWPARLVWGLWALFVLGVASVAWLDQLLRQAGRPDLVQWTAEGVVYAVLGLGSATAVGALVASRRPVHPVGWLLLAFGLLAVISHVARGYVAYALVARPGTLPAASAAVVLVYALSFSGAPVPLLALALLLTPTGSLPSRRWRWVAIALVAVAAVNAIGGPTEPRPLDPPLQSVTSPLAIETPAQPLLAGLYDVVGNALGVVFVLAIVAGAGSLVVRFRRARGVERQQLRWVAFAAALVPVAALVAVVGGLTGRPAVVRYAAGTVTWLVPLALGAAVLHYRLYDLDRIISRTLAYGLLTLLLGGGYAGAVLLLGQWFGGIGDRPPSWAVAGATLAVAALFQPARRRVQAVVDRQFNRRRYDAAHTIAAFSTRLRQEVDLDTLTGELLAVVEETMQPAHASLWLRQSVPAGQDQPGVGVTHAASPPTTASPSAPRACERLQ
jgi:hypothetical protein